MRFEEGKGGKTSIQRNRVDVDWCVHAVLSSVLKGKFVKTTLSTVPLTLRPITWRVLAHTFGTFLVPDTKSGMIKFQDTGRCGCCCLNRNAFKMCQMLTLQSKESTLKAKFTYECYAMQCYSNRSSWTIVFVKMHHSISSDGN